MDSPIVFSPSFEKRVVDAAIKNTRFDDMVYPDAPLKIGGVPIKIDFTLPEDTIEIRTGKDVYRFRLVDEEPREEEPAPPTSYRDRRNPEWLRSGRHG